MKINLKEVKSCIFGIQGSGKTFLTENFLIKNFKHPLVYRLHKEDFNNTPKSVMIYEPKSASIDELNNFCPHVKELAQKGEIDAFIIDEADFFFPNNSITPENITDLVINHRHYGLALIFISRRPQDIQTRVVESSEHMFIFKIEGENVERKFKAIHPKIIELLSQLKKDEHNFIYKKLGEGPIIHNRISLKSKGER